MTTPEAERRYLREHLAVMNGRKVAVYNPHSKPVNELPVIYGFNNGGSPGWYSADLMAEDGTYMGGHVCSHEGYMLHDLGIIEDTRPDRHEDFKRHYPDGYRMAWVPTTDVRTHEGLNRAYALNLKSGEGAGHD